MPDITLTQSEADALVAIEKVKVDNSVYIYPSSGDSLSIPLISSDGREQFFLDITRSRIKLSKCTYQNRVRSVIQLVRVDLDGPPHRNPDNEEVPCPHIHIYREGFADKWAYPLPVSRFPNSIDLWSTFQDFMSYCNVTQPPWVKRDLWT